MDVIGRGIIAGFLATLALSVVLDPIATVVRAAGALPPNFGWTLHFLVGSLVWGAGFSLLHSFLPGPLWLRGIVFGFLAWMIVMLAVMPLTRGGLFGLALGLTAPAVMLAVHLIYGALLAGIYGLLDPGTESAHDDKAAHDEHEHLHPLPH